MQGMKDFYKILGISETASAEEIKNAYRKLAKKYHPDRHGGDKRAESRFKEISEAYAVLSDPKKRQEYDTLRKNPFAANAGFRPNNGGFQGHYQGSIFDNLGSIFEDLFTQGGGRTQKKSYRGSGINFEDIFQQKTQAPPRGTDYQAEISIPFELAMNGGETLVATPVGKRIKIKIPAGVEEGKKIRVRGHGSPSPAGGVPGDLFITIHILPHPSFERKGKDIYSTVKLNLAQAVLGTEIQVNTIHGKKVKLKIPPGTSSDKIFRIPKMGIKTKKETGAHLVKIQIETPKNIGRKERQEFARWAEKVGLKV